MIATTDSKQIESKKGVAGLAGASGGTLVAVLASGLKDSNPFKQLLLYAAPSLSVLTSVVWIWTQVTIGNYFRDKEVRQLIAKAKQTLQDALNNPNTSEEHKAALRKKLEELELLDVNRLITRVDSLKIITSADVSPPKE